MKSSIFWYEAANRKSVIYVGRCGLVNTGVMFIFLMVRFELPLCKNRDRC